MKFYFIDETFDLGFVTSSYLANGSLAVIAYDKNTGTEFADVTVNLPLSLAYGDMQYLDVNNSQELIDAMVKEKYIEMTDYKGRSGYVLYPMGVFTEKFYWKVEEDYWKEMYLRFSDGDKEDCDKAFLAVKPDTIQEMHDINIKFTKEIADKKTPEFMICNFPIADYYMAEVTNLSNNDQ